jgi:uncharacterized protein (TIGR03435 family)
VDETGLAGEFDMDVTFMPDQPVTVEWRRRAAGVIAGGSTAAAHPRIQEDLGLKLEPRRRDVDVLVIDRVERPTEN